MTAGETEAVRFTLQEAYPSRDASKRMRWNVGLLPFRNGSMWALIGAVHLLYAWMIQSVLRGPGQDFSELMPSVSLEHLAQGVWRSPMALVLSGAIVWGMAGFTKSAQWAKRAMGAGHGLAHLALAVCSIYGASRLADPLDHGAFLGVFVLLVGVGGGLLGSWLLAAYLLVADRFRCNTNELFAAGRSRLHKNFLRLHLGPDGALTVYPIKVERPPARWKLREPGAAAADGAGLDEPPWFEPVPRESLQAELIEQPVRIEPAGRIPSVQRRVRVGSARR